MGPLVPGVWANMNLKKNFRNRKAGIIFGSVLYLLIKKG
jgi:hypothetical protein